MPTPTDRDEMSSPLRARRRLAHLQVVLGSIWIVDALLQAQPANFSSGPSDLIIANAMGQPHWLQSFLVWSAERFAGHDGAGNLALVVAQLALGVAIIAKPTRRTALLVSIPYAFAVWVVGEGFGNVASGFAMFPAGAPGAALLYCLAAALLLPARARTTQANSVLPSTSASSVAAGGEGLATAVWCGLFFLAALLQAIPVGTLGFKLSANFQMATFGEPSSLARLDGSVARFVATHGPVVTAALIVGELFVGSAALVTGRTRRNLLVGASIFFLACWAVGENFGEIASGSATDVGAMPVYGLIAAALWPLRLRSPRPVATSTRSSQLVIASR